jgi:hypothetical protein
VCLYFVVMLNKYCSYDIHVNTKINIKHGTDILLKMSNSQTKFINSSDFFILLLLLLLFIAILLVIYSYIHKTKHISAVYNVAIFCTYVYDKWFFFKKTFSIYSLELSAVCAQYPIYLFTVIPPFRDLPVLR